MTTPATSTPEPAGDTERSSLARDASPPDCDAVSRFGAELRRMRLDAGLGTRRLAARSGLSRKSVQFFEAGVMRPRRCTIGALGYGLDPDDPPRRKGLIASLIAAAGGEDALATDGKWPGYRQRRFEQGLLNGSVPLPAEIAVRLSAQQQADRLRRQAYALLQRPGTLDDGDALDAVDALLCEARRLSDTAGGMISLYIGNRVIRAGFGR